MDDSTESSALYHRDKSTEITPLPEGCNLLDFPEELLRRIDSYFLPYDKINFMQTCKVAYHVFSRDFITLNEIEALITKYDKLYGMIFINEKNYYDTVLAQMWNTRIGPLKEIHEEYKVEGAELLTRYQKIRGGYVVTYELFFGLLEDYKNKSKTTQQPFDSVMKGKSKCYKACSMAAIKKNTLPWSLGTLSFIFFLGSIAGMMALAILAGRGVIPSGNIKCVYSDENSNSVCKRELNNNELAAAITFPFAFVIFGSMALAYWCELDLCCIRERLERKAPLKYDKTQAGQIKESIFYKAKTVEKASILLKSHTIFKEKINQAASTRTILPMNTKVIVDGEDKSRESEQLSASH